MLPLQNEQDSAIRNYAEKKIKQQGSKLAKKLAKKGAKAAFKLIKAAAMKFVALLAKLLAWLASIIGLPVIGIGFLILITLLVISLAWSYLYGTGEGLQGYDKEIHEYIVEQAYSTVDMDNPIERPYRVPEKLIAATIQLEVFQKNDDIKEVIKKMAKALAPTFDYGKYDEWIENQVTICEDGICTTGGIQKTQNIVTKLNHVDYWNGSTTFKYTPHVTDWEETVEITYKTIKVPVQKKDKTKSAGFVIVMEDREIEVKKITKTRRQYYTSTQSTTTDYSTFDNILNSYGLGINDKALVESNYLFMGGTIAYTDWLKSMGIGDFSGIFFDGNIIPGAGVPPQFMPYYLAAEKKYGVHWYVLAAMHCIETTFSTNPNMVSSKGAIGHIQFMPATWVGWKYDIGGGLVSPNLDITSLAVIASGGGYGVDANNDGKADPWNIEDSIHSAAHYLSSVGYSKDVRKALWHYNHAEWYINEVLSTAETFKNAAKYESGGEIPPLKPGSFMRPTLGPVTSPFGYRDGEIHFGIDIGSGGKSNVPIVAAADGVVHRSYFSESYGNVVFIKHKINGQQYETIYAHMQNRAVAPGATVKQGQFLGYMGSTGWSYGVHLHFEVHKNEWTKEKNNAINPALVVPF